MRILHITDIHFDGGETVLENWNKLLQIAQKKHRRHPFTYIMVTGDIVYFGKKEGFEQAEVELRRLLKLLGMKEKSIFFCPGNHDADEGKSHSGFEQYQKLVEKFGGNAGAHKKSVKVVALNTATETSWENHECAKLLPYEVESAKEEKENYGIVLMHHPPEAVINQEILWELVENLGKGLILCGHSHTTQPRVYRIGETVVINGMAVNPHLAWLPSGMQVIRVKKSGKVRVKGLY